MPETRAKEFLAALADVLEVSSIGPADDYRETPLWGSLTAFALKVMLKQRYRAEVAVRDLCSFRSAGELMERALG
ncbi:MAG: hypothetical protein K6F50_09175 [Kiritimatiellae bacterium]|nr:hypothetical protein [Kiritimatiellia bacterium]